MSENTIFIFFMVFLVVVGNVISSTRIPVPKFIFLIVYFGYCALEVYFASWQLMAGRILVVGGVLKIIFELQQNKLELGKNVSTNIN